MIKCKEQTRREVQKLEELIIKVALELSVFVDYCSDHLRRDYSAH